jgi:hypothetical protein
MNYLSEKEGFLIVWVEYNLKVSSIYYFHLSYSFPNIKVSCIRGKILYDNYRTI